MSSSEDSPALRLGLLRELAHRLSWSALAYGLFSGLFCVNFRPEARTGAVALCGLLIALGIGRMIFARRVMYGRHTERDGRRLIHVARTLSLTFGVFVAYALWHVRGQVIPESLMALSVAGLSSTGASIFAPFPRLNRLNTWAQLAPLYVWSVYAFPRYGWLLEALIVIHALAVAQTIRMNGAHIREMLTAQITLQVQSEYLQQARDAAEQAASAKMRFLANMSHEIRTPLNGILGLAEVMSQLALTAEQRTVLTDIDQSGQHLLSILNDILDMAKVTSGKLSLQSMSFHLPGLIREIASPAAALAEARQVRFVLEQPPDLPPYVRGDPLRIRQVVSNLLGNAVKFTPQGEVRLSVRSLRPDLIRFEVADTGIGLSPEQMAKLFQEFHQVDSSPSRKFGGSGLGLAISRRFAELMGGRIWVESRLGAGSTFFFDLPIAASEAPPPGAPSDSPAATALPPGLRVLVAEDNAVNRKVIAMMLSQAGAVVEIAENGRVAVERQQARLYDVILMDCQMPELDGYAATAQIRSLAGGASEVPIIGVTANAFAEDRERCLSAGMNGYVAKPLSRAALLAAIAQSLSPAVR